MQLLFQNCKEIQMMDFRINACLAPLLVLNLSSAYAYVARPRGEEQVADPQQDSDPAEQLCRSLGHQMDVLSQSVAFCEEKKDFLSRNAPGNSDIYISPVCRHHGLFRRHPEVLFILRNSNH